MEIEVVRARLALRVGVAGSGARLRGLEVCSRGGDVPALELRLREVHVRRRDLVLTHRRDVLARGGDGRDRSDHETESRRDSDDDDAHADHGCRPRADAKLRKPTSRTV